MADKLQGLNKHLNKKLESLNLGDKVKEYVINLIRDAVLEMLKKKELQDWIAGRVSACAQAVGVQLNITDITDKDATRADFDAAITAKVNQLAGTTFPSLAGLNREAVKVEAGRVIGEKLGTGPLYPVEAFRDAVGSNLVQSFAGPGPNSLFDPATLQAIEEKVVKNMQPISERARLLGNPMAIAGAPETAAQAAARADNRRRQAKYRRKNMMRWVPMGGPQ